MIKDKVKVKLLEIFMFLFFFFSNNSYGQECTNTKEYKNNTLNNTWTVSYFGRTITHPGAKVSYNLKFLNNKINRFNFAVQPSIGFYYHRSNQTALFTTIDFLPSVKLGKEEKWYIGLPVGIGYMRTFIDGKTYLVDNVGNVSQKYFEGSDYFMPLAGFSMGYYLKSKTIEKIHITFGAFGQYPYNSYILPNLFFEIGVTCGNL